MVFNLLCAPCVAAMGAIRREMNNAKWTAFAITYQCLFAYAVSLMIYQFGSVFTRPFTEVGDILGVAAAMVCLVTMVSMLFKPFRALTGLPKRG